MKSYSEMTDFEINCLVGGSHRPSTAYLTIWLERLTGRRLHSSGRHRPNGAGTFDWCNDPEDAWDIIYRHRIGVIPARQPGEWRAAHRKVDSSTPLHLIQNPNPFRAAMTVFL